MLHVVIDATAIPADRGGVGRYLDGLVPALVERDELRITVACQPRDVAGFAATGARTAPISERLGSRGARLAWEQTGLPRLAARLGADVLHCPHYTMPLVTGVGVSTAVRVKNLPTVVTLHDATFFSDPQLHTSVKGRFFRAATRFAVRRATALIVPSAATRNELSRLVSVRADQAIVAHHGVDPAIFRVPSAAEVAQLRADLHLGGQPFIAFLGTIEPRKNVPALIAAWQTASAGRSEPPALVLAGGRGWDADVDGALASVPASLRVIRPGYLPLDLLPALLGGAELVCYPALGEGFGLPVLEAMSCGAATVTTRRLALPEIGGDAVDYCPVDSAGMAAVLAKLLDDPSRRAELAALGLRRAADFSWAASAKQHLVAYRLAAQHPNVQAAQL